MNEQHRRNRFTVRALSTALALAAALVMMAAAGARPGDRGPDRNGHGKGDHRPGHGQPRVRAGRHHRGRRHGHNPHIYYNYGWEPLLANTPGPAPRLPDKFHDNRMNSHRINGRLVKTDMLEREVLERAGRPEHVSVRVDHDGIALEARWLYLCRYDGANCHVGGSGRGRVLELRFAGGRLVDIQARY